MMFQGWSRRSRTRASTLGACLALSLAACGSDAATSTDDSSRTDEDESATESTGRDGGSSGSTKDGSSSGAKSDAGAKADAGGSKGGSDGETGGGSGSSAWCKVKPVFEKHCTSCHDGEGTAGSPMGLTKYAETQEDAPLTKGKKVYETIGTRIHDTKKPMPPKGLMSAAELAIADEWTEAGAEGDDADCTGGDDKGVEGGGGETAAWPAECTEQNRFKVVAKGSIPRGQETHPQFFFDAPWGTEERQMLALKNITDNKKVLHHWILYSGAGAFITGWAPSDDSKKKPLPDDVGMYLPSGPRSLRLDMHYHNLQGTQAEVDASGVEICAVPKAQWRKNTASVTMSFASFGQGFVLAPANKMGHESTGTCRVNAREPVHVLTASPHAHTLAKAMRFTVTKANGQKITMHEGPFNFEEQSQYPMDDEIILNTGDTVTTTCVFDNPTNRNVTFGENTGNEMCFNFALYYPMNSFSCSFF